MLQTLNTLIEQIGYYVTEPLLAILLLGTGLYFSWDLRFPQIRYFNKALGLLLGKATTSTQAGNLSPFQALATSLGGSIGTGNITGVALAIHLGGPASLFWMLVTAFLGMTTKFIEVTLCHKYREKGLDSTMIGGPMYYMRSRLKMPWFGVLFSLAVILTAFAAGNLPQTNSIAKAVAYSFGLKTSITGLLVSLVLAFVIIGGARRIAQVAEWLIPFMSLLYLIGALTVLVYNHDNLLPSFVSIFSDIFSGTAATGGFLGASMMLSFRQGINRGLFSNDAGVGISGIAHASSKLKSAVTEGIFSILEPFISTALICMLTGMVILTSNAWKTKVVHRFDPASIIVLEGKYDTTRAAAVQQLADYVNGLTTRSHFQGNLTVQEGVIMNKDITCLHARSVAEEVRVHAKGQPFTGPIAIKAGHIATQHHALTFTGSSLLPSGELANHAFNTGFMGRWGHYIVTISLFFFAFTTVMAWYYYSNQCLGYLGGHKYLTLYKLLFVGAAFVGAITDATIVWNFSNLSYALIAIINLIGLWLMHKDTKSIVKAYHQTQQN